MFSERLAIVPWSSSLKDLPEPGSSVISTLRDLTSSREVKGIVFGIPWYHLSGDVNPKAAFFLSIGRSLNKLLNVPVYFWDEGMTSEQARESIIKKPFSRSRNFRSKQHIDSLSAALMLQSFLAERVMNRAVEKGLPLGEND